MVLDFDTEIEMLLFDQNKIVTYKELTNKFNISPVEAKLLLEKFKAKNSNKSNIFATYLVIIDDYETKKKRITLVNDDNLAKLDKSAILSKQIYSLQAVEVNDFNLIYSNDTDASNNLSRKSNIDVVNKLGDVTKANTNKNDSDSEDMELVEAEKLSNLNLASKSHDNISKISENIENKVPVKHALNQNEKPAKPIKEETKELVDTDKQNKRLKLNEETNSKPAVPSAPAAQSSTASATAKKIDPKKPTKPANQSTLTSFFKKA